VALVNERTVEITLTGVTFSYGPLPCLHNLSLSLQPGTLYGLIGPNGSGKSTLLDIIGGFARPQGGRVTIGGRRLESYSRGELARLIGVVPQSFTLNFDYSVEHVVLMGRYPYIKRFSGPSPEDLHQVRHALELLDIAKLAERPVRTLSGGEKQRVMVARTLAQDTPVILLDEATANLDIKHAISIMHIMAKLVKNSSRTVVAALHDLNMACAYSDQIIALYGGKLVASGTTEATISPALIETLYQVPVTITAGTDDTPRTINYRYH
jgi:ABC-type cobalamin/Fe3+-siderophores transport system ATPase subunit